jgi:hypothetical protein
LYVCGTIARADHDIEEPLGKVSGDDKGVATVIARTGQNEGSRAPVGQHIAGDHRRSQSGPLHQRLAGGPRLNGADVRETTDRLGTHWLIISTVWTLEGRDGGASVTRAAIRHRQYQSIH